MIMVNPNIARSVVQDNVHSLIYNDVNETIAIMIEVFKSMMSLILEKSQ